MGVRKKSIVRRKLSMFDSMQLALKDFIGNILVLNNACFLFAIKIKQTLDLYDNVVNILVRDFIAQILV